MKQKIFLISTLAIIAVGCSNRSGGEVRIVAHRGYWDKPGAVRNSVAALRNAMEEGFFGSEFDVLVTADGIPVVHHDDKTANGILIESATCQELMRSAPTLGNGERIPSLEEYLMVWDHHPTKLVLEIKSASSAEKETFFAERVIGTVKEYGVEPHEIEYIAFSLHMCREIVRLDPAATVSYLNGDLAPREVALHGLHGIDYHHSVLRRNPEWVEQAHELGLVVNTWTVNSRSRMREMIELGVDYITTDDPAALREIISANR